jgi:hypothetical protein
MVGPYYDRIGALLRRRDTRDMHALEEKSCEDTVRRVIIFQIRR